MKAKLIVVGGKTNKRTVALRLPTVIGRSRDVELTIAHPMISRRHCQLFEQDGLIMLRDLGSLNGTMIGGRRIERAPLLPEAEFTVGPLTFRVEYEYDGDLAAVPDTTFADEAAQAGAETIEEKVGPGAPDDQSPDFQAIDERPAPASPSITDSQLPELPDLDALADVEEVEDIMESLEEPPLAADSPSEPRTSAYVDPSHRGGPGRSSPPQPGTPAPTVGGGEPEQPKAESSWSAPTESATAQYPQSDDEFSSGETSASPESHPSDESAPGSPPAESAPQAGETAAEDEGPTESPEAGDSQEGAESEGEARDFDNFLDGLT